MGVKREFSDAGYFKNPSLKYPTAERAEEVDADPPYERLRYRLLKPLSSKPPVKTVLHWFRRDFRIEDNKALSAASKLASEENQRLLTVIVLQPAELEFHGVGNARKAFMADSIHVLQEQLRGLNIPLVFLIARSKKEVEQKVLDFAKANEISDVHANFQYEFDELTRDIAVADALRSEAVRFHMFHDETVLEPGTVTNQQGEPRKVFTSFWQAWIPTVAKNSKKYLSLHASPTKQSAGTEVPSETDDIDSALQIDRSDVPKHGWEAGHSGAVAKLDLFLKKKIQNYAKSRSLPAEDCVSRMSPYISLGLISIREIMGKTRDKANKGANFGTSNSGPDAWVRELVFREHYRQMMACVVPHMAMNMPSSLKLANVEFEQDPVAWERWCLGQTGMPFVDAGMRQLNAEGYMHNRCRMNVASYLKMHLLIDFRLGMNYFANKLLDWDCCNNSFGWDPSYTVFNPVIQGEKCDPKGEFIRKWVPELKDVTGKAIFDPSSRLSKAEFEKLGYPSPMIDQQSAKARSIERFKSASADAKRVKSEN